MSRRESLLLAEDDAEVRTSLVRLLERDGYAVAEAAGGEAAVARFRSEPVSLVLTDLVMAEGDGFHLLKEIRELDPEVPIVVLTGYPSLEHCTRAFRAGASHFLTKPLDPKVLLEKIREIITQATSPAQRGMLLRNGSVTGGFTLPGDAAFLPGLLDLVTDLARISGYGRKHWAIRRSLLEAARNAVSHGAGNDPKKTVEITATFGPEVAEISVGDTGPGFSPDALGGSDEKRGVYLIRTFTDEAHWLDGGRRVVLRYLRPGTR